MAVQAQLNAFLLHLFYYITPFYICKVKQQNFANNTKNQNLTKIQKLLHLACFFACFKVWEQMQKTDGTTLRLCNTRKASSARMRSGRAHIITALPIVSIFAFSAAETSV
jgi:hypothetical protein